jgi:membrane protein DedA with SNARE-associated domain
MSEHNIELSESSQNALISKLSGGKGYKYVRFVVAALGSIPWVGGFIAASASLSAERDQQVVNNLQPHRLVFFIFVGGGLTVCLLGRSTPLRYSSRNS